MALSGLDKSPGEGTIPDNAILDQPPTWPDIWPDQAQDIEADQYMPAPFGCKSDADCFGQKCCKTPWGIKLCAPTCR